MFVKKGEYAVIAQSQDISGGDADKAGKGGGFAISKKTIQMEDIPLVGQEKPGTKTTSDLGGKQKPKFLNIQVIKKVEFIREK